MRAVRGLAGRIRRFRAPSMPFDRVYCWSTVGSIARALHESARKQRVSFAAFHRCADRPLGPRSCQTVAIYPEFGGATVTSVQSGTAGSLAPLALNLDEDASALRRGLELLRCGGRALKHGMCSERSAPCPPHRILPAARWWHRWSDRGASDPGSMALRAMLSYQSMYR